MPSVLRSLLEDLFGFGRPETPGDRLFFRIFEGFIVAEVVALAWVWALYIRNLPGMVSPLGLANFVDVSLLYGERGAVVAAVLVTVLSLIGFGGRRIRLGYPLALLLLHLLYVARFNLGKVGHGSTLIGMSMLGLCLAAVSFGDTVRGRRFALGFVYFFVGLAYVLSASAKLIGTGLFWPDGHHLTMWMAERALDMTSQTGSFQPNPVQVFLGEHTYAATAMLTFGLSCESLGWLLWWRRTRPFIAIALVGLHLGIALVLDIHFDLFIAELLLIGLPWPALLDRFYAAQSP